MSIAGLIEGRTPATYHHGMASPGRTITDQDRANAARLLDIWEQRRREARNSGRRFTQELAAEAMGVTQGMIGQYLHAHAALNTDAILFFARYLNVLPTQIAPEFEFRDMLVSQLPPDVIAHLWKWMKLPPNVQADFTKMIDQIAVTSYSAYLTRQEDANNKRPKKRGRQRPR